jgi:peptide chain release factor 2
LKKSKKKSRTFEVIFEIEKKQQELQEIEKTISAEDFWQDQQKAQSVLQRRARVSEVIDQFEHYKQSVDDLEVWFQLADQGETVGEEIEKSLEQLRATVDDAEIKALLSGENDHRNAIVTIHPGAGGTESQDWASMLLRMYLRWADRKGYQAQVLDSSPGEEAGISRATIAMNGPYAYGYLSAEAGVHRLVRISPFDANKRRHTSFASVFVYPDIEEDIEIKVEEKDLKIDTYRAGGPGGQHVNVTDSAVRITHIPTGIVVQCQNERSQFRNREVAMKVLKARLYEHHMQEQKEKLQAIEDTKREIGFGSQIRSYVLHPYKMVKDHRTKEEKGDVDRVLDGDLDDFIKAYLLTRKGEPA